MGLAVSMTSCSSDDDDTPIQGEKAGVDLCDQSDNPLATIIENFDSAVSREEFTKTGWANEIISGERSWSGKEFSGNKYVQMTAHNAADGFHEAWLITPPLNVTDAAKQVLTFKSAQAFWNETTVFEVYVLQCQSGVTTKVKLDVTLPTSATPNYEFIESGEIDLSEFSGTIHIGFYYKAQGGDGNSTSWSLDDVTFNDFMTAVSFTSSPVTVATANEVYTYNIVANVKNAEGTTVITATGLPDWLTLTDNQDGTATLTGTAPELNDSQVSGIVITAVNNGLSETQEFSITLPGVGNTNPNLVVNGDFENWTDDTTPESWDKAENVTKETTIVKDGTASLKQVGDGTKDVAQLVAVEAGKTYLVSVSYNVGVENDGTDARIWCVYKKADGTADYDTTPGEIKGPDNGYLENGTVEEWQNYSTTVTIPAGITHINFETRTYSGATVYWDNFSVVEQ